MANVAETKAFGKHKKLDTASKYPTFIKLTHYNIKRNAPYIPTNLK